MDHKTWLWRKRSSEKTIVANDKPDLSLKGNEEVMIPTEKEVDLERSVKNLNEKLASVLYECNAKDDLVANHEKMAQEAIAGREKAEAEVVLLKQELDETSQQRVAANERLAHLNAALKEYMQQLSSVREEHEQRIHDAVMKTSREFEKAQRKLEEKYTEASKRLANLIVENSQLSKALLVKEKLIEDLSRCKSQAEAEFNTLMARLDSIEKENAFLKYEFRMLEKELEIRNEEIEFNRRSANASHKQHLESVKKIKKLEAECQRLRVLVRKRLPGPAVLGKMKNEVEMQGRNPMEMRSRKLNPMTGGLVVRDATRENPPEIPSKKISFLIERLCDVEEENKILKEILAKKDDELHSSRITCAQTDSKLSHVEAQLRQLSRGQKTMELARCSPISNELSLPPSFDIGNDDETIGSGSWASALISELEHFRHGEPKNMPECKTIGVSDMSLMDDFVEMEKLAIVSIDTPFSSSSDANHAFSDFLAKDSSGYHLDITGKELVPVGEVDSGDLEEQIQTKDVSTGEPSDWLQHVLKVILDHSRVSKRSLNELLNAIRIALTFMNHPSASAAAEAESSKHPEASDPFPISGYITWKSPKSSPRANTCNGVSGIDTSVEKTSNEQIQSNLSRSICKIIELIKEINPTALKDSNTPDNWSERDQSTIPNKNSATTADYSVYEFQWKSSELSAVLQHFVQTCNDLLNGKASLEKFSGELTSALDWIVNNCITFQDVSSVRDKIKKHFGRDGSQSELGVDCPFSESDKPHEYEEQLSCLPSDAPSNRQKFVFEMEKIQAKLQKENRGLKNELNNMESSQKNLEAKLRSATDKSEALMNQLRESEQSIGSLQTEMDTLKESKGMIEDQIENQKLINEDLDTQLTVAKVKLNAVLQKLSSLEVELEDKIHCCEELEATCLELQLQLESITKKEIPKDNIDQEEKLLQTGWEITAASAKLAECQETILNLGRQLKALTSSKEAATFDKVFSTNTTNNGKLNQRSSLRDRMLAEDDAKALDLKSPKTKEMISTAETKAPSILQRSNCDTVCSPNALVATPEAYRGLKHVAETAAVGALAIVPSKKRGGGIGLLRKLLLRRKRGGSKKTSLYFAT